MKLAAILRVKKHIRQMVLAPEPPVTVCLVYGKTPPGDCLKLQQAAGAEKVNPLTATVDHVGLTFIFQVKTCPSHR